MDKNKKTLLLLGAFLLALLAVLVSLDYFLAKNNVVKNITNFEECVSAGFPVMETYPRQCRMPNGNNYVEIISTAKKDDLVVVYKPLVGSTISSPVEIEGEARGNWYFEASFPIKIVDDKGKQLGIGIAQAQGEWMTTEYVPFKAVINFVNPGSGKGEIVLEKDNPSGLPQNADELRMPIVFGGISTQVVKAYFVNARYVSPDNFDCRLVYDVSRNIPKTETPARFAIEELLKGPSDNERAMGFETMINQGVKIQKLTILNGIATIDFDKRLEEAIGGSCRVSAVRSQIVNTLMQFSTVKRVIISIDGRTEDILQP